MKKSKKKNKFIRITAGKLRGKNIECPAGEMAIRPMTAKVKEALFNILGNITNKTMLDVFTGSGSISIEAFSRGIKSADIVEGDFSKRDVIKRNLENTGFKNANLFISDAISYCETCSSKYDIIMLDPPFAWDKKEKLLEVINEQSLLNEDGILIIHLPKKENLKEEIGNLAVADVRNYGLNTLIFYENK